MKGFVLVCLFFVAAGFTGVTGEDELDKRDAGKEEQLVTVYTEEDYDGASETYSLPEGQCVNIESYMNTYISSIMPARNTCVLLFSDLDCKSGPTREATPRLKQYGFGSDKLVRLGLNDKVKSLKRC